MFNFNATAIATVIEGARHNWVLHIAIDCNNSLGPKPSPNIQYKRANNVHARVLWPHAELPIARNPPLNPQESALPVTVVTDEWWLVFSESRALCCLPKKFKRLRAIVQFKGFLQEQIL